MAGPAPTEVLQYTKDRDQKFHEGIANDSTEAGHPATPQSVNPDDESALEPIKRDFQHLVGSTLEEGFSASNSVNDRDTKGRIPTLIAGVRRRMKKAA